MHSLCVQLKPEHFIAGFILVFVESNGADWDAYVCIVCVYRVVFDDVFGISLVHNILY